MNDEPTDDSWWELSRRRQVVNVNFYAHIDFGWDDRSIARSLDDFEGTLNAPPSMVGIYAIRIVMCVYIVIMDLWIYESKSIL